jgi:hypothetical protein
MVEMLEVLSLHALHEVMQAMKDNECNALEYLPNGRVRMWKE